MEDWTRRETLGAAAGIMASAAFSSSASAAVEEVTVNLNEVTGPLDHIWSRCGGSDRATISLSEAWRRDLSRWHEEAGLERVRFHGVFIDEMGVWPNGMGPFAQAEPNFQKVDAVYDGLIERGVKPFVELSFMPGKLASGTARFGFYNANITPPTSLEDWSAFITRFARHLCDRYGAREVGQWMFDVWNEPNLGFFWSGTQAQYFELYKATALALKSVNPQIKVGGPTTSAVRWIPEFLDYCATNNAPVDFVSTHAYAGDNQRVIFGEAGRHSQNDVIPAAVELARQQISASRFSGMPLWLGEWTSDSPAMIAHIIKGCLPHCQGMSHWVISSEYEELRVANYILKEGNNGWGAMAQRGIPKPAFNTYRLLHRLGDRRLASTGPALAARSQRGVTALVWNLANVPQPAGIPDAITERTVTGEAKTLAVSLQGARRGQRVRISYVDLQRASPFPTWRALGSPLYPSSAQVDQIRNAANTIPSEVQRLSSSGVLNIELPPEGVALLELI